MAPKRARSTSTSSIEKLSVKKTRKPRSSALELLQAHQQSFSAPPIREVASDESAAGCSSHADAEAQQPSKLRYTRSGKIVESAHVTEAISLQASNLLDQGKCCDYLVDSWKTLPRKVSTIPTRVTINDNSVTTTAELVEFLYKEKLYLNGIVAVRMPHFQPNRVKNWAELADDSCVKEATPDPILRQSVTHEVDNSASETPIFGNFKIRVGQKQALGELSVQNFIDYAKNLDESSPNDFFSTEKSFEENSEILESIIRTGTHLALYNVKINASLMIPDFSKCSIDFSKPDPGMACFLSNEIPDLPSSHVYLGSQGSIFPLHSKNGDAISIDYCYEGKKYWYGIPIFEAAKLENVLRAHYPAEANQRCQNFLRHKAVYLSEAFMNSHGIKFVKIVQNPGDIIVTFPRGYHQGFNAGYSCSEAIAVAHKCALRVMALSDQCTCSRNKTPIVLNIRESVKRNVPHFNLVHELIAGGKIRRSNIIDPFTGFVKPGVDNFNSEKNYVLRRPVIPKLHHTYYKDHLESSENRPELVFECYQVHKTFDNVQNINDVKVEEESDASGEESNDEPRWNHLTRADIAKLVEKLIFSDFAIAHGATSSRVFQRRRMSGFGKICCSRLHGFVLNLKKSILTNANLDAMGILPWQADALKAMFLLESSKVSSHSAVRPVPKLVQRARKNYGQANE